MKEHQPHLLPECFGDTLLVNTLIDADCNHKRSISQVFVTLKSDKFRKKKAVGIIDDDKRKDVYFKEFKIMKDTDCFKYLKHPNNLHFLIVLKKDLEDLLVKCGDSTGATHRLLRDKGLLKKAMKSINVGNDPEVKDLLNTLLQKKAEPLLKIKSILEEHKV
jgi:hypothetical protein